MLEELQSIKERLFDAPKEVKESFNNLVNYFEVSATEMIKLEREFLKDKKVWEVAQLKRIDNSRSKLESLSGPMTRSEAIREMKRLYNGKKDLYVRWIDKLAEPLLEEARKKGILPNS